MIFLAHRGLWYNKDDSNQHSAFVRALEKGFGIETDFRDFAGSLVVSHDPPGVRALFMLADEFFSMLSAANPTLPVAINVKADGLQSMLKIGLEAHGINDYFLFDMSIPDALQSIKAGLRIFVRQSDVEPEPLLYAQAQGIWMDAFYDDSWITPEAISRHLDSGKSVCLVSPELHGRDHRAFWDRLPAGSLTKHPNLMICTDMPEEARNFFNHA